MSTCSYSFKKITCFSSVLVSSPDAVSIDAVALFDVTRAYDMCLVFSPLMITFAFRVYCSSYSSRSFRTFISLSFSLIIVSSLVTIFNICDNSFFDFERSSILSHITSKQFFYILYIVYVSTLTSTCPRHIYKIINISKSTALLITTYTINIEY